MARKSRKTDFVSSGFPDRNAAGTAAETQVRHPVFRAGLYARISLESDADRDRNTVETQMELLKKFAEQASDLAAEKEYFDISRTGTDFERPGFDEMMQDIRNGRINCVIVKDLSRLGRNYVETGNYIERVFPFFDVRFIAVTDGYDSANGEAGLAACMSNIFNEYYSRDLAGKIRAAHRSSWEKGRCVAGSLAYSLKRDPGDKYRIIHDEEAAAVVARMYVMFLAGKTYAEIAGIFNEEGQLNPRAYKRFKSTGRIPDSFDTRWQPRSIPKLLSNPYYMGDSLHGKHSHDSFREKKKQAEPEENWVIVRGTHEPVVPAEVFEEAQKEMERRKERRRKPKNPGKYSVADRNFFKEKIVCVDCGKTMYLQRYGRSGAVFNCGSYVLKKQCSSHRIHDTDVYEKVLKVIHAHISVYLDRVEMIRRLNRRQESIDKYDVFGREIRRCRRELEKLAGSRERLYEDYVSRLLDAEQYECFKERDTAREKELRARLEELSAHRTGYSADFCTDREWEKVIDAYRNKRLLTKKMVDAFVEKIEVCADRSLKIRLVYDDMLKELAGYAGERAAEYGE
ncbi:MAG: recombinase family protein [Eubacterium sp.]|nr:recombinase family protein [Eubacterium sp.]